MVVSRTTATTTDSEMTDRTIPRPTIEAMVRTTSLDLRIREASPADHGHMAVYRLAVDDHQDLVLKATPDGDSHGIPAEARLLALLGERTSIPVPGVVGVVDDHEDLPAPFFLMTAMPGEATSQRDVGSVPDEQLQRVARDTGRHLAELHGLDAVDAFGYVSCDPSPSLRGERPPADGDELVVTDARDSWPATVRAWSEAELDALESTRFADLTPRLQAELDERLATMDEQFDPALTRVDHGLHNLMVDEGVVGVIDWAFTLASTAGYDLATVTYILAGSASTALPDVPDRRDLVREAMLDGYRDVATVPGEYRDHRELYELLALVRTTNHLDAGMTHVREENVDAAVEGTRAQIQRLLGESGGGTG